MLKRTAFLRKPPEADRLTVTVLRSRKCRICFTRFTPDRKNVRWCSGECAVLVAKEAVEKQAREKEKASRLADREKRQTMKSRGELMEDAQKAFNAFIRARDVHQPCICCGKPFEPQRPGGSVDAGHYLSRGAAPHMRFVENNVHAQRKNCNRPGGTSAASFRLGMIARIGLEAVEALECDQTHRKWTDTDLVAIKNEYRAKLRALTKT